jgi:hypothetical protein
MSRFRPQKYTIIFKIIIKTQIDATAFHEFNIFLIHIREMSKNIHFGFRLIFPF